MAFASRLAIISGGAGGIGSAVGIRLRQQGAKLALLYAPFEQDTVSQILQEVYGSPCDPNITAYPCDITCPQSVEETFDAIITKNDAFPCFLVNTAGYINLSPLKETSPEDILRHYMINLYGPTLTGQAFARTYLTAKTKQENAPGARIVNMASQAAHVALDQHGAYCASKAGLLGLTRCQASEWGAHGITSNTVSPGPVWTTLGKKAWADEKARRQYQSTVPTGAFADAEEIAYIVSFLCQDSSKNINGTDIKVDGGYTAR